MALKLDHRVSGPKASGEKPWPAVVMVHGWLGNENVMSIFERTLPPEVMVVSPRAPLKMGEDNYGWFKLDEPETFTEGLAALEAFVRGLPEEYPIDAERVVLMGFSQGAAMSFALLLKEPALAVGVAGLAGFLPRQAQPRGAAEPLAGRLAGKRTFLAHGTEDETVPVAWAREAAERLRTAGAEVVFNEYAVGHKMNAEGMRDLKAWMGEVIGK